MHNYKLLKPLLTLLQTRSLTESARRLNVTQSAMSRTLAQIRDAFDDPILVRQGKGFVPTARGESLLEQLPQVIEGLDTLYAQERFEPEACDKQFTLAHSAFLPQSITALICHEIAQHAPNASLCSLMWQQENLDQLLESSVELLAATLDTFPENIYGKKLIQDQYVVIMSPDNPLSDKDLALIDYLEAKHVTVHGMQEMKQLVSEVFIEKQKKRHVLAKVPSFIAAIDIVRQGNGLVTAPLHIAGQYPDLHICSLPFELPSHTYYLAWHAKHQKDPAHRWYRELSFSALQSYLSQSQAQARERLN